jgi:CRP-like cAMP-binding protein
VPRLECPLDKKTGIAAAQLIRERERLLQELDDLAALLGSVAHRVGQKSPVLTPCRCRRFRISHLDSHGSYFGTHTRQDIADYLGLTSETISRMLAQLTGAATIDLPASRLARGKLPRSPGHECPSPEGDG